MMQESKTITKSNTTTNSNDSDTSKCDYESIGWYITPTTLLPNLVALDMFSVALVVPLLHQYYKNAGVSSASQRELLSSLFNGSQIIGGITIGVLSDMGVLTPRNILFISFLGSALSYSLIISGNFRALLFSRILVGLVKQTMTVSTSILAKYTDKSNRTQHMARIHASSSIGFIIGPSVGGFLYKHVDRRAPAFVAAILFLINFLLAAMFIPPDSESKITVHSRQGKGAKIPEVRNKPSSWAKYSSFTDNLQSCFSSKALGSVIICVLIHHWVTRATSYSNLSSYYEELFGIEPHQRGYLASYQNSFTFVFQAYFVKSLLLAFKGEYNAACAAATTLALSNLMQYGTPLFISIGLACPMRSASISILNVSLTSLVTLIAPKHSLATVLAALDVLKNMASVTVPLYRTFLFRLLGSISKDSESAMDGDPSPLLWVKSSVVHWILVSVLFTYLLPRYHTIPNNIAGKDLDPANTHPASASFSVEKSRKASSLTKESMKSYSFSSFLIVGTVAAYMARVVFNFQTQITKPLGPGSTLVPGAWRRRCGFVLADNCEPAYIEMGTDGILRVVEHGQVTFSLLGKVCDEDDKNCVPGLVILDDGTIKLGGAAVKVAVKSKTSLHPWPFLEGVGPKRGRKAWF